MTSVGFGFINLEQQGRSARAEDALYQASLLFSNGYAAIISHRPSASQTDTPTAKVTLYTPDRSGLLQEDTALMQEVSQAAAPCDELTSQTPDEVLAVLKNIGARPQHPFWSLAAADKNFARRDWKETDLSRLEKSRERGPRPVPTPPDTSIPRLDAWNMEAPLAVMADSTAPACNAMSFKPAAIGLVSNVIGQGGRPPADLYERSRQNAPSFSLSEGQALLSGLFAQAIDGLALTIETSPEIAVMNMPQILECARTSGRDEKVDNLFRIAVQAAPMTIDADLLRDWSRDIVMKDDVDLPEPKKRRLIHMLAVIMPLREDMMPELRDRFRSMARRYPHNEEARSLAALAQRTAPKAQGRLRSLISRALARGNPTPTQSKE